MDKRFNYFSYLFLVFSKKFNNEFRLGTIITQNFLLLGFLAFLLFNSNPFSYIFPVPLEGLGLNPILQDPALAIHPPLLYVGFVGSSIYFSAAISSLFTNFGGKQFALSIKPWVIISWVFQTLGILVGSIWAYYELGWGGFWFLGSSRECFFDALVCNDCFNALTHCFREKRYTL